MTAAQDSNTLGNWHQTRTETVCHRPGKDTMSYSSRSQLNKFALILIWLCVLHAPSVTAATASEEYVERAMQLLRDLFPGLKDVQVVIPYAGTLGSRNLLYNRNSFEISLDKYYRPTGATGDLRARSEDLFTSHFQFHNNNEPCQCVQRPVNVSDESRAVHLKPSGTT